MPRDLFDVTAFYSSLDKARETRSLTWKRVAKEAGVSASTLTRMAQGKRPDVDSLAALVTWAGLSADDFVRPSSVRPESPDTLSQITAYLRADPSLSPRAAEAMEEVLQATYKLFKEEE